MIFLEKVKLYIPGIFVCAAIALGCTFLGQAFPLIGGPVFGILAGMAIALVWKRRDRTSQGITFTSKKILQYAVILLGFGLNLAEVVRVGAQSLPVIVSTIATALIVAFVLCKALHIPERIATLVGVGSSICGGSAIAATAPVIDADDEEVAQAISVIFFFNVLAAILFPSFGKMLGFDTLSGNAFGVFAGTAINDTSSVTAAASTWDGMWNLGSATLDKAVTVKLTRTLAIIPITLFLAFIRTRNEEKYDRAQGQSVSFKDIFPFFILYFMAASILTTIALKAGVPMSFFQPIKELSKFFIVLAMAAIGLNTNLVKLIKTGGKPIFMGACCWAGITAVSLLLQSVLGIW